MSSAATGRRVGVATTTGPVSGVPCVCASGALSDRLEDRTCVQRTFARCGMGDKRRLVGRPVPGEFAIRDLGGWYTVEKLGFVDTSKTGLVLCSTGSLEHAQEYKRRVQRSYTHPNSRRGND